jgi:CHAT domain-containing protein/tetratricopeptide (TPR) repeat protein
VRILLLTLIVLAACHPCKSQEVSQHSWKILYDSTQRYWAKDWNKAVRFLTSAEKEAVADLGIYDQNYLTIVNDLGLAFWRMRDYKNAETYLSRALKLRNEAYPENIDDHISSLSNLASMYCEQGNREKAKQLYKQVIDETEVVGKSDYALNAIRNLISLHEMDQEFQSAVGVIAAMRRKANEDDKLLLWELEILLGREKRLLKKYAEADAILESLQSKIDQPDFNLTTLQIKLLGEIGLLNLEVGFYSRAEKCFLQALKQLKSGIGDPKLKIEVLNNLANVYDKLNIYDKALAYYYQSREQCIETYGQNSLPCSILENNIAGIHLKQGDFTRAIQVYEQIKSNLSNFIAKSDELYITTLNNLATAYRNSLNFVEAATQLDTAKALIKKHQLDNEDIAAVLMNNIAVLHTTLGQFDSAVVYYEKAFLIRINLYGENSLMLRDILSNMAVVQWARQKPEIAIPLYSKSIELSRRQIKYIFPGLNENEQVQFYQNLREDFERFNTLALEWSGHDENLVKQVFNNQLLVKSLIFFTQQRRNKFISTQKDSFLVAQHEALKLKREQLGHLYQMTVADLQNTGVSIADLEKEVEHLEKELSLSTSDNISEISASNSYNWESIHDALEPDEALIDIIRYRKYDKLKNAATGRDFFGFTDSVHYAAIITTADNPTPKAVLVRDGNNLESRYLNYYRNCMAYGVPDRNSYNAYWMPFVKHASGKERIYVSPDGVYHKMNLSTLRDPETQKFLVEDYQITRVLNPVQLLQREMSGSHANTAVLLGDPAFDLEGNIPVGVTNYVENPRVRFPALPGSYEEVVTVDKLLKSKAWSTSLYVKGAARESLLKTLKSPGILHIATHGFFSGEIVRVNNQTRNEFLFHSGIVLSGANKTLELQSESFANDGILTAFEVMNLDLSETRLVVLSACETGLGKVENGEGVYGLQRSFLQAGADHVLISLWKVDDQITKELMIKFYSYLADGHSIQDSLKLAQVEQMKSTPNPFSWGAFVLVGAE